MIKVILSSGVEEGIILNAKPYQFFEPIPGNICNP
jgi:hypothetical protein